MIDYQISDLLTFILQIKMALLPGNSMQAGPRTVQFFLHCQTNEQAHRILELTYTYELQCNFNYLNQLGPGKNAQTIKGLDDQGYV